MLEENFGRDFETGLVSVPIMDSSICSWEWVTSLHQKILSMGLASSPANRVYTFRKELAVLHPPPHSVGAQQKEVGHSHHCEPAQIICPGCHLHCTQSFIILGDENETERTRAGIELVEEQRKAHNQQALLLRTHNSAITIGSPHSGRRHPHTGGKKLDCTAKGGCGWSPLRVHCDKTATFCVALYYTELQYMLRLYCVALQGKGRGMYTYMKPRESIWDVNNKNARVSNVHVGNR